jgi:peptidoglycan/xylan/chitin deacetylase (PgdA/CDA1 family)
MRQYLIKTPWIIKRLFNSYTWRMPANERAVYLTFDDGPHPEITPWVLEELAKYNALATFFCIGKNVVQHPEIYDRILNEKHSVGNHTYNHNNGWKTTNDDYINDVRKASEIIHSNLFRPPYGKIRKVQAKQITDILGQRAKIIMWDVLSADFDQSVSEKKCLQNIMENVSAGSIIVFHDSEKAFANLKYALPRTLEKLTEQGYEFKRVEDL